MRGSAQFEIVRGLADAVTVDDASEGVLATLARELGWDVAILWLAEGEAGLRRGAHWNRPEPELHEFLRRCDRLTFEPGVGAPGRVWGAGRLEWFPEVAGHPDLPRAGAMQEAGLRSAVAVPVDAYGVIELLSVTPRERDGEQEQLLISAAGQLAHFVERARVEDRLQAAEERMAAILDAALDAVITMDHEGRIVDFSLAAEATFGHTREGARGQLLADLIVPPELRDAHRAGLARYLATGEGTILGRRLELTAVRADGSVFPVELTVTRVGTREPPLFAGFVRDITRRHAAETERLRLVQESVVARQSEQAARVRAETERRRMAFLAEAGLRMAASLDYTTALEGVARAAVPHIADLCAVTVVDAGGRLQRLALAHSDPVLERTARELVERHPPDPEAAVGASRVIRTGLPELVPEVGPEHLRALAEDDDQLETLRRLGLRSALTVPVRASGRTLGAIALFFGASGRRFDEDDLPVATALGARAGLHIENARLYTERSRVASTLQQSFLPAALPEIPGLEVAAHYRAAGEHDEVGGDFYDVFASGGDAWTALIGDVSGKGAAAAALTALTRHTLYATSLTERSPARNLALLNEAMRRRAGARTEFCTVLYARLHPRADATTLTLASGGHPSPLILRAGGTVERVETTGTLIGAIADAPSANRDAALAPGDLLLLYTDGAIELRRDDLAFGERALAGALREHAGRTAEEVVDGLARHVEALRGGSPRDDVALLALRMLPTRA